jgi:hypothetical protein
MIARIGYNNRCPLFPVLLGVVQNAKRLLSSARRFSVFMLPCPPGAWEYDNDRLVAFY